MSSFDAAYFEAENFWSNGMLEDAFTSSRINTTKSLIPGDVKTLLDVGCGNGVFLNSLLKDNKGIDLLGVDRSSAALKYLQTKSEYGNIASLIFQDRSFDCVTSLQVLEHLPNSVFNAAVSELARVAKNYIIVSVPFEERLEENSAICPSCKSRINRDLHLHSFTAEKVVALFDKYGFKNTKIVKEGEIISYAGHATFRRYFRKKEFYKWDMPVCPVCGLESAQTPQNVTFNDKAGKQDRSIAKKVFSIPKLIWPKSSKFYWIIGLFERKLS